MPKLKTQTAELKTQGDLRNSNTMAQLYSFVERFERLSEEISALTADRTEVMGEAKSMGFDPKVLRMAIRRRAMDTVDRQEQDSILELYEEVIAQQAAKQVAQSIEDGA